MDAEVILVNAGQTRRVSRNGRDYLVVPMTLIRPGILSGSKGPLYYPQEEIAKSASQWNDIPVVVNHPLKNGSPVSGKVPDVLDSYKVGRLYGAKVADDGSLKAEGWLDIAAVKRVDNRILSLLESGKQVELSTGLFTDNIPAGEGAAHNGKPYSFTARSYVADHLAILPDTKGACSVKDGCGANVQNEGDSPSNSEPTGDVVETECKDEKCDCPECSGKSPTKRKKFSKKPVKNEVHNRRATMATKSEMIETLVANCDCDTKKATTRKGLETLNEETLGVLVANAAGPEEDDDEDDGDEGEAPARNEKQTEEQWLATAPPSVRSMIANYKTRERKEKTVLVNSIVASPRNRFTKEWLLTKDVEELEGIAALATNENEQQTSNPPMFYGAAGAPNPTINKDFETEDADMAPAVINWAEAKKGVA